MGRSVNKVTLIGTLGRDPEVRYMPNGNAVANLSLATDESYNDKTTGQKVEQTEWHRVTVYGKLAEIVQQYLFKGSKAYFEGKLRTREWEKDGVKRYTTEIIASDMTMCGSPQGAQQTGQQGGYAQPPAQSSQQPPAPAHSQQTAQQPSNLPPPPPANQAQGAYQQGPARSADGTPVPGNSFDQFDDDIPF